MGLFARDGFVEVQEHAGDRRPGFLRRRRGLATGGRLQLLQQFSEPLPFVPVRRTGDAELEREIEFRGIAGAAFTLNAFGQGAGEFEELLVVEERERLQW